MYQIGQIIQGKVTGIQPYGVFIELDNKTQGLIHISELKHAFVKDITDVYNVGELIDVQIMDIDEYSHKISLSTRSLTKSKYHPYTKRKKVPRYGGPTGVGFESLDKKMPGWVDEALAAIIERN